MSDELIRKIIDAEEAERLQKLGAQADAKNAVAEAEAKGRAAAAQAVSKAEEAAKRLLTDAEEKAAEKAAALQAETAALQAEIRRSAGRRLDEAAGIIVERIVNG